MVPTDSPGLTIQQIPTSIVSPDKQFTVFLDEVRVGPEALVGTGNGLRQVFSGLNPERIWSARCAGYRTVRGGQATDYARNRRSGPRPSASTRVCRIRSPNATSMSRSPGWRPDCRRNCPTATRRAWGGGQYREVRRVRGRAESTSIRRFRCTAAMGCRMNTDCRAVVRHPADADPRRSVTRWSSTSSRRPRWVCVSFQSTSSQDDTKTWKDKNNDG